MERVADEFPSLARLWAQMLEQRRYDDVPEPEYECDACQDKRAIFRENPTTGRVEWLRPCGSPLHSAKPVVPAHSESVRFQ